MANRWNLVGKRVRVPEITSSRCIPESTVTGTLSFEVAAAHYPNLLAMGVDECARSDVYSFGGYDWGIELYPYRWWPGDNQASNAMAYLWFLGPAGPVHTKYTLSVLGNEIEEPVASFGVLEGLFSPVEPNNCWGTLLKPLSELGDGGFTLQYVLTVINVEPRPMELPGHLERMLVKGRRADVRFRVRGRNFRAHSSILAERSPVFEAQLFGPMAEKDMRRIKVVGMRPAIFKMMLRYIYTDILPSCNDQGGRSAAVMQRLLVAADRYGLDRLKLMCEEELCRRIDAETIMSMHALAHRYHCDRLKHACLQFLTWSPEVLADVFESSGFNELCMTNYRPLPLEGEVSRAKRSHAEEETDPGQK
ncbi:hypothetical protein CFC21_025551 [Triticum aestivum]|uniref:BTB domain-containing protein n=2 Tax=Triticum aestivum TaxID=4565 RepID=A0A3B6CD91_WHEAT|nr:BTB/POZ and MATH domain-containing protein 2-like [Triticum aestivum]KAF7011221.1 hypothetical protein CFC21_025551 [Triticum aestivum]